MRELESLIKMGIVQVRLENGFVPYCSLTNKGELICQTDFRDNGEVLSCEDEANLQSFLSRVWLDF